MKLRYGPYYENNKAQCFMSCRRQQLYEVLQGTGVFPVTITSSPRYLLR